MLKCPLKHLEKRKVARQEPAKERTVLTSASSLSPSLPPSLPPYHAEVSS